MMSSGEMMKMRMRQNEKRERAKSTSALTRIDHEREVKIAKRRKQDENRLNSDLSALIAHIFFDFTANVYRS